MAANDSLAPPSYQESNNDTIEMCSSFSQSAPVVDSSSNLMKNLPEADAAQSTNEKATQTDNHDIEAGKPAMHAAPIKTYSTNFGPPRSQARRGVLVRKFIETEDKDGCTICEVRGQETTARKGVQTCFVLFQIFVLGALMYGAGAGWRVDDLAGLASTGILVEIIQMISILLLT